MCLLGMHLSGILLEQPRDCKPDCLAKVKTEEEAIEEHGGPSHLPPNSVPWNFAFSMLKLDIILGINLVPTDCLCMFVSWDISDARLFCSQFF